jgi:flagellar hook-associated protein 2
MSTSISGVGSISSAGLGSGLDVNSIVTQLMAVERRPLAQLQSAATGLKAQVSTFGKVQSYFSALQDKSNALISSTLWNGTTATSGDTSAVTVSTSASGAAAAAGSYAVNVQSLASAQTVTAAALPSSSATLNQGTLAIEIGSWTGTPTSGFTAKPGGSPVVVTIGPGETSLSSIRDKINAAGAGVTASIVNDASGARLSLRSSATGAENAFRVIAAETVDDGVAATGLTALAFDAAGGSSQMTRSETAVNAKASINGIDIASASNTLSNVVDGMTINLLKPTTSAVAVSVAVDTIAIKQKITDFVGAFNDLAGFLRTQMAYNPDSKSGGALQGDQAAVALQRALRGVLNQASSAASTWSQLSDIGIAMKVDGTLETNTTKLDNAMGNLPELRKLLATDGTDSASSGFVRRWKTLADAALGSGGTFENRTTSLNARLRTNDKSQDAMSLRLNKTEARMRAQYTALDAKMAQLNGLSTYMTQQLAVFNKSGN